jgi:hypothetical protein
VYSRAEHNGIRYFVSGGGGAPLYPRRPNPSQVDLDAVVKFERAFHFLRVTVTGDRVEVTAVRTDGTVIETTGWTGGGALPERSPMIAMATATGGPAARSPAVAPAVTAPDVRPEPAEADTGTLVWSGLGGVGLLLAAAVAVVRTLRR